MLSLLNAASDSDSETSEHEGAEDYPDPVPIPESRNGDKNVTFNPDQVELSDASDVVELLPSESDKGGG